MHILSESTGKGVFYDWNFNSTFIGSPDECAGRLQHAGDKGDQASGFRTSFVQFTALLVCLVIWYFSDGKSFMTLTQVPDKWTLLGGVIGAFITVTVIKSMNSLGPAKAAMLIVISQLIIAYVIELLGWFGVEKQPLTMRKVAGMAIAIIGVVIFENNGCIFEQCSIK